MNERGRITYVSGFVDADIAAAWFTELRDSVSWRTERRMMYDREVDVARLMGHYWLDPPPASLPSPIREAAARVNDRLGFRFNSVGLNRYRDGRDSVAPHNDHLNELQEGYAIALLSLGATRRMTVRAKEKPPRVIHVDLAPGSLFVMDYARQIHYTHAVQGLVLAHDRYDEQTGMPRDDHVLDVNPTTVMLANVTVRRRVATALDSAPAAARSRCSRPATATVWSPPTRIRAR